MRQVACPNCGRMALVEGNGPDRCLYCGAELPPAPDYRPAWSMPGAPAPLAQQPPAGASYPQAPGASAPMAPPAAPPPGYPPAYPPPGYGQPPAGYGPVPPGYGQAPPGYGQMPPGTPIDPRMQPPGYPYGFPAPGPGASYPYPYAGPAPYGYPGAPTAEPAAPPKRRRRWPLVGAIVLLVVLLLGGGGAVAVIAAQMGQQSVQSGTPAATPVPTIAVTIPNGFIAYQDPGGLYGLGVPSGWQQLSSSSGGYTLAEFADATQHASLAIEYTANAKLQERDFDDQILKQLPLGLTGASLSHKSSASNAPFANETWAVESADLTLTAAAGGTTTLHVVVQTASHVAQEGNNPVTYLVAMLFVAPGDTFASLNTRYFQPAQQSFAFAP